MTYPIIIGGLPITEIRIVLQPGKGKLLAMVNITLGGSFAARGCKVLLNGQTNKPFVVMANHKLPDGSYSSDHFCFVTAEGNTALANAILEAYNEKLNG